jgi:hypothetical protein
MVAFLFSGFWMHYPNEKYTAVGWSFLTLGLFVGMVAASARAAVVPGDYVGWSGSEILLDQMKFASAGGATLVLSGLVCLFSRRR